MPQPFFSIGITTYNRHDLLKEALDAILAQDFSDFEVIVGNDYQAEVLTGEMLVISDPRIRFVNHPRNLREVGNMNALLGMATGRYFTWLFDDDLYEPNFLQTAHDCLIATGYPPAFFSSFKMMREEKFHPQKIPSGPITELTGREFLRWYSPRQPKIASTFGLFDTVALRETVGGLEELCSSAIGVYSEYLFLVRCALLERIIFMDAPFYLFRIHSGSWSESESVWEKYIEAGKELVRRSAEVLRHPALVADFDENLMMICEQHLVTVAHRSARSRFARNEFFLFSIFRAIAKYRKEALETRNSYARQGGDGGLRRKLTFIALDIHCYYVITVNVLSCFYRRLDKQFRKALDFSAITS